MKTAGWILIGFQIVAIIGGEMSGNSIFDRIDSGADLIELIGFFLPAIIGAILLYQASEKEKEEGSGANPAPTTAQSSQASKKQPTTPKAPQDDVKFCPGCGAKRNPGNNFCTNCGRKLS